MRFAHKLLPATAVLLGLPISSIATAAERIADNLRWSIDLATRSVWVSPGDSHASANFLGLDVRKIFSGEQGDFGTLLVQPYLIRIDNMAMHPPFFDGPDDTAIEYRILNFNITRWGQGRSNIRIGHFEIPFGLEQVVNTNGTLRDYLHGPNLGVKADWGLTINGDLPRVEYELAVSRGSGNDWSERGNPYIVSGRIGTARERRWVAGLSFFSGRVLDAAQADLTTARRRAAFDVTWHGPRVDIMAEFSTGDDESRHIGTALLELDVATREETLSGYLQFVHRSEGATALLASDQSESLNIGTLYTPDSHWSMSAQWSRVLSSDRVAVGSMLVGQLRYRF
jgi:hypothetical protein